MSHIVHLSGVSLSVLMSLRIYICLLFSEWRAARPITGTQGHVRPMSQLCHRANCKTKEAACSNQHRFGYIRSLKYHLVVMLYARIDIIQPLIRNLIAYLLPLPDKKKTTTAVFKWDKNERTGQKRSSNMIAFASHASYQKRFNKVLSFVVMGASKDFLHLTAMSCMK